MIYSLKYFISADMQLVRFRGLVQNMLDPEIYLESYQTKTDAETLTLRKGKFRDNLKLEVSIIVVKSIEFCFYFMQLFNFRKMKSFYSIQRQMCMAKDDQFSWFRYPV